MGTVSIRPVNGHDKRFMENVIEKYLYEMSAFMDVRMDSVGHYVYPQLDSYFGINKTSKKKLYVIELNGERVGFVMVSDKPPYEPSDQSTTSEEDAKPDWYMAEFTVFPKMRNCGIGRDAVEIVVARHPGRWEIMFDDRNAPAKALWTSFADDHDGTIHKDGTYSRILTVVI